MIGDGPGLTVRTDDNLHDYLEVAVSNGTLRLATRGDGAYDIDPTDSITWTVHTPQAIALHLSGAGFIGATGVQADRLEVVVDGVGDIDLAGASAAAGRIGAHAVRMDVSCQDGIDAGVAARARAAVERMLRVGRSKLTEVAA